MDRQLIYPGQVPVENDLLKTNQNVLVGLAKLSEAIFGTAGMASGFTTTQTVVPSLAVLVAPGEIYSQQNLEATAFSSLPQDLTHTIVKQGLSLDAVTLAVSAPGTAGFSINYLVQVAYQDVDSGSAVLPYYNAANPSVAFSGPANSGSAQPTIRQGVAVISLKAGTAATSGTQTTPAPDTGKLGLYVVTVASGASAVANGNITPYPGASLLPSAITSGRLIATRVFTSSTTYVPTPGTKSIRVRLLGGGGAGGGATTTPANAVSAGAGGGSGAYLEGTLLSGFSGQPIQIGAGGSGVSGLSGNAGGATAFAGLTAQGGSGGAMFGPGAFPLTAAVANTAVATGGYLQVAGQNGGAIFIVNASVGLSGIGANGPLGAGASPSNGGPGANATGYGSGGSGGLNFPNQTPQIGGAGRSGIAFIEEYT